MGNYHYFCDCCGHHFTSDTPYRTELGLLSEIDCPECGAWDIYPDTPAEAAASRERLNREEERELWRED